MKENGELAVMVRVNINSVMVDQIKRTSALLHWPSRKTKLFVVAANYNTVVGEIIFERRKYATVKQIFEIMNGRVSSKETTVTKHSILVNFLSLRTSALLH